MEPARISVARLLALGATLSWEDAIAIAQGVVLTSDTAALMGGEPVLVRPETIFLTTAGDVDLPRTDPAAPPDGAVQLLRQLLEGVDVPPDVARMAASHDAASVIMWLARVPLDEPGERLATLARSALARQAAAGPLPSGHLPTPRPPRQADVRTAGTTPPPATSAGPVAAAPVAPSSWATSAARPDLAPGPRSAPPAGRAAPGPVGSAVIAEIRRRLHTRSPVRWTRRRWQAIVPVVAAIGTAAIVTLGRGSDAPPPPAVATNPLPGGIVGFVRPVSPRPPGASDAVATAGPSADTGLVLPDSDLPPLDPQGAMAWPGPTSGGEPEDEVEVPGQDGPAAAGGSPVLQLAAEASAAGLEPAPTAATAPADELDRVFSAADPDVAPPAFRPRQRATDVHEPGTPVPAGWPYLLIVVDERGGVETVRLFAPPTSPGVSLYRQRMLVAAAKAWRFVPAARNGRPVRYELRLPLEP